MRIAVNFPYFIPYTGYFRLFASTDLFVIFDCVPFPRRGYVHRNQLPNVDNDPAWLTIPLQKVPRDTYIRDMQFVDNIDEEMQTAARRFPVMQSPEAQQHPLVQQCLNPQGNLVYHLETTLKLAAEQLNLSFNVVRSSSLPIDRSLKGEERVRSIVSYLGGTHYINAPGGRHLYDREKFRRLGIELSYLDFYHGNNWSILYRLLTEDPAQIRKEILQQSL